MIEDTYGQQLNDAAQDRAARFVPGPTPAPYHSWSDLAKAPFQGAASGLLESAATWVPNLIQGGAGGADMGIRPMGPGLTPQQASAAMNPEQTSKFFRAAATDVFPDAQTSSTAAQLVAGFANFGVKAAIYTGTLGPAGALPFGADLYGTEKARLMGQGVQEGTASQAALENAAFGAGSVLIPAAAPLTRIGRAALGLAVGEGANVGQAAAEKYILQTSGYKDQAQQFDPFDPVALGVGAVPAVLGGILPGHHAPALRDVVQTLETGGIPNPDAAVSRTGAEGRMQVEPATQLDPGFGVKPADLSGTPEQQKAEKARVGDDYIAAMEQRYGGDKAKALAAYNAGPGTLDAILKDHPDDWEAFLPHETQDYLAKARGLMGPIDGPTTDAARVTAMNSALDDTRLTPDGDLAGTDAHRAAVETAFDQAGRGDPVEVPPLHVASDELQPVEPVTNADLEHASGDDLEAMLEQAQERNRAVDIAAAEKFFPDMADKFREWNQAQRDRWMDKNGIRDYSSEAGMAADDWMQARYVNDDLIREHLRAGGDFDTTSPQDMGQSIALRARKMDEPGFWQTPDGRSVREAMQHAKAEGWNLDDVLGGMRERMARFAGNDAPELFQRAFRPKKEGAAPVAGETARGALPAPQVETPARRVASLADAVRQLADMKRPPEPKAVRLAPLPEGEAEQTVPRGAPGEEASPETAHLDATIAQIAREHPDLMVHLDGMDQPMRADDLLQHIQDEAQRTGRDSELLNIAAQCAIRS